MQIETATATATVTGIGEVHQAPLVVNDNVLPIIKVELSTNNIATIASKAKLTHYEETDRNIPAKQTFVSEQAYGHLASTEKYFVSLLKIRVEQELNINLTCTLTKGSTTAGRTVSARMNTAINGLTITPTLNENKLKSSTFNVTLSFAERLRNIDSSAFNQNFSNNPLIFTVQENGGEVEVGRLHLILDNQPLFFLNAEPKDYKGEYGFDWMKPEYISAVRGIYQSDDVADDSKVKMPICTTIPQLEAVYNPTQFFEYQSEQYFSSWIALMPPPQGQAAGPNYKLKLSKKELAGELSRRFQLEFRSTNPNIQINDHAINNVNTPYRVAYTNNLEFNIRCTGTITGNDVAVNIFAVLENQNIPPYQVGRILIYPNDSVRDVELVFVHLVYSNSCNGRLNGKYKRSGDDSLQNTLNTKSLNQLLVSCPTNNINTPLVIDLRTTPTGMGIIRDYQLNNPDKKVYRHKDIDGITDLYTFIQPATFVDYKVVPDNIVGESNIDNFRQELNREVTARLALTPNQINKRDNLHNLKIIILINVSAQSIPRNTPITPALKYSTGYTSGEALPGGNNTSIYCGKIDNRDDFKETIIHEIGHLLGIENHPFEVGVLPHFLHGYTDFYMDYSYDNNVGKKTNFPKTQFSKTEWDSISR